MLSLLLQGGPGFRRFDAWSKLVMQPGAYDIVKDSQAHYYADNAIRSVLAACRHRGWPDIDLLPVSYELN